LTEGNLYGTTALGGSVRVVFQLTPKPNGSWTERVLHRFTYGKDGVQPIASVIFDTGGNLYGMTYTGGNLNDCRGGGCGVVYKLAPNSRGGWSETLLHTFTGGKDGAFPLDSVIFDQVGNLYSTTLEGGSLSNCGGAGCGVVFKLTLNSEGCGGRRCCTASWTVRGAFPDGVIFDAAVNLYGTTRGDGKTTFGSVFEITP
jgi:uncharacterized repeat protein (TIGR03803 family)